MIKRWRNIWLGAISDIMNDTCRKSNIQFCKIVPRRSENIVDVFVCNNEGCHK